MQFTQVKETCLYVQDLEKTKDFYHGKLGLPVISLIEGRHVFFRAGSSVLLCFKPETTRQETRLPPHFGQGQLHMAFEAREGDYEHWKEKLRTEGIAIEHEQDWGNGRFSCYFRDPDQHCIEIVEPCTWGNNN